MIVETEVASSAPHPPGHPCKYKLRRRVLKRRGVSTRRKAVEIFSTAFFFHLLYPFQLKAVLGKYIRHNIKDLFISHRDAGHAEQTKGSMQYAVGRRKRKGQS
jgi:hypothetical protein